MHKVYKYELSLTNLEGVTSVPLPAGFKVLSVGTQGQQAFVWVEVNTLQHAMTRNDFIIRATGEGFEPKDSGNYVGTFMLFGGGLVFHVYHKAYGI